MKQRFVVRRGGIVKRPLIAAMSCALALGAATPASAASELDVLRQQLEQQQKMLENQQKVIDRLEKQSRSQSAGQPPGAASHLTTSSKIPVVSNAQIEIYGGLIPFVESVRASGATTQAPANRPNQLAAPAYTGVNQGARGRMTVGTSNIGFRGSVDVADSYKAIWQIEAGAALDGDSAAIGGTNVFGLRNSNVGLDGRFGTVFFGNWDTPYKWSSIFTVPLRGAQQFDYNVILGNPGFGVFGTTTQSGRTGGKADAAFDRRQGNSVQYWTPAWNGFSGRIAYSLNEGKSGSTPAPQIAPRIWSLAAAYQNGPLEFRYAYEQHEDYFGMSQLGGALPSATNASSKDQGQKFIGSYSLANTRFSGTYERLKYQNNDSGIGANVKAYQRNAYNLTGQQKLGPGKAWLTYGSGDDGTCSTVGGVACSTDGLGAKYWVLGYVQTVNKFVDLFATYYAINNKGSGTYQPVNTVNVAPNATPAPGLQIRGLGVGAVMLF